MQLESTTQISLKLEIWDNSEIQNISGNGRDDIKEGRKPVCRWFCSSRGAGECVVVQQQVYSKKEMSA